LSAIQDGKVRWEVISFGNSNEKYTAIKTASAMFIIAHTPPPKKQKMKKKKEKSKIQNPKCQKINNSMQCFA
jgi:hypothetical protein